MALDNVTFGFIKLLVMTLVLSVSSRLLLEKSLGLNEDACSDQLSSFTCNEIVAQELCANESEVAKACRKSCGFCSKNDEDSRSVSTRGPECQDMVPACEEFGGLSQQQFCCMAISFMNQTCPKSCMFCTETALIPGSPIQGVPSLPVPGGGGSGDSPSVVTQQNPCKAPETGKPPTVGVNPGR